MGGNATNEREFSTCTRYVTQTNVKQNFRENNLFYPYW